MSSGAAHCDLLCGAPLRQWLCRQFAIQSIANQRDLPELSRQVLRANRIASRHGYDWITIRIGTSRIAMTSA